MWMTTSNCEQKESISQRERTDLGIKIHRDVEETMTAIEYKLSASKSSLSGMPSETTALFTGFTSSLVPLLNIFDVADYGGYFKGKYNGQSFS